MNDKNPWAPVKICGSFSVFQRAPVFLVRPISWPNSDWLVHWKISAAVISFTFL